MKAGLFTLLLAGLAVGSHAQTYCGTTLTKSGTGMSRTYTVTHPNAPNATWSNTFSTYPGNFSNSTGSSVTRNYTYGGYYYTSVLSTLSTPGMCVDSAITVDTIYAAMDCSAGYLSVSNSGTGNTRTFTSYVSSYNPAPGYTTSLVTYNYGDGTSGQSNSHTYASAGTYTVTASVTWASSTYASCTKTATTTVTISNPQPTPTLNCNTTHAQFTTTNNGNVYTFTNTSLPATLPTGVFESATWNFGDGSSSTGGTGTKTHAYTTNGTYNVTLSMVWYRTSPYTVLCHDSISNSITVTGNTPAPTPNVISGYITIDSNSSTVNTVDTFKVWLIQYDSSSTMLTAVDSQVVFGTWAGTFQFANKPAGSYRVKAKLLSATPAGSLPYIPTYGHSSAYWSSADVVAHTGGTTYTHINMLHGTPVAGNGFVSGSVLQGANKGTAAGDPVAGQLVLLRDGTKMVRSALTNAKGEYTFTNVPAGTYTVYPEEMNYATTPSTSFVITGFQNSKSGIGFRKNNSARTIVPGNETTGISTVAANSFELAPNPTSGRIRLTVPAGAGTYSVSVTALTGQTAYRLAPQAAPAAGGTQELDLSQLAPGIYNVTIQSAIGTAYQNLVIQH